MTPVLFRLGPFEIRWYGILVVLGILAGGWLAAHEARRRGEDPEVIWEGMLWAVILGVIGARLYHIFTVPPSAGFGTWD